MRSRGGFTVVEVMVALVVVTVGLLALTATAGLITRMIGEGGRLTGVGAMAHERLERVRRPPCPSVGAGVAGRGKATIRWEVTPARGGRQAVIVIESPARVGQRLDSFTTIVAC